MCKQRLALIVTIVACLAQRGQVAAQQASSSAVVPVGASTYRLVLTVTDPPAPTDWIQTTVSTAGVITTLVTPDGRKITAENAESSGFKWAQQFAHQAHLGSDDRGQYTKLTFRKPAPAGRYILEFAFRQLQESAKVEAHFTSRMAEYLHLLQSTPGAQISKAVPFRPSATVTIDLPKEEDELMFDVVLPDASTDVVLVLPDGRKLRRDDAKKPDVEWNVVTKPEESPLMDFDVLLPAETAHQVIGFKRAPKGRYEIQATQKTVTRGEMRVAVVPLTALAKAAGAKFKGMESEAGEISSSGGIKIHPQPLPYECFVGDSLPVEFELVGEVGSQSPQFEVREERSAWLRDTDVGVQYAPPDPVEILPVQLTKVGPQSYKGTVVPSKPGSVRISVKATGKTASGQPFTTETLLTNSSMMVRPIAARFLGVTAKAMAPDGGSKFDRLEVTAALDVLIPGDYLMLFGVRDAAGARPDGPGFSGRSTLQAGRQNLTVSVSSSTIWKDLRDGPFEIFNVQISRTQKSTLSWINVPTGNAAFQTPAYRHDQWDPGKVYGADHVTVHGVYPTASGRFRFAEVEWEVTTPGLLCNWNGSMRGVFRPPYTNPQPGMDATQEARLPSGKTKVSFIYDGATIHRFGKQDWTLYAVLNCGDSEYSVSRNPPFRWSLTPPQKMELNPDDYEPSRGSFSVNMKSSLRLSPGATGNITVWVPDRTSKDVQFAVTDLPKGLEAKLSRPLDRGKFVESSLQITTSPETAPGRYLVSVSVTSGREVETSVVLVDVMPE